MAQSTMALIVIGITFILFGIRRIPLAVASSIGAMLMIIAGIVEPGDMCAGFGNYICVLLASTGIISASFFETGMADRLGERICQYKFIVKSEKLFLLLIIIFAGTMSMFVANIPVVALFIPIISTVAASSGGKISKKHTIMALGFAATIGGNGSLIGSSTNMTGQISLQSTTGDSLEMFSMLPQTILLIAVMLIYYGTIGYAIQKKFFDFEEICDREIDRDIKKYQRSKGMIVCADFLFMMIGFLTGLWNMGAVALAAALVVVITGCISWQNALKKIDWSTIIVVATSLVLAKGMNVSGAGTVIADFILKICGGEMASPMIIVAIAITVSSILSCLMANNAVVAIMIPIFCTIAQSIHIHPVPVAAAIICGCNICYATPISTAPITMTLSAGYRFTDYVKAGGLLLILSDLILILAYMFFIPL